ncbi:MAG: hypothetical protein PS018_17175 [bacterium]|nr:hypothetical protein [bacterium]
MTAGLDLVGVVRKRGVADAVVMLVRETMRRDTPHELERVTVIGFDGQPREVKRFPAEWARRLVRAVETGAFRRREVKDIVETILTTSEPPQ